MYLEEITQLTSFISLSKRSIDDICKYLVVHTFRNFTPRAIYVGQIDNAGHLSAKATFGFDPQYIDQFKKIPLNVKIPIIESIRSDEIIYIATKEDFFSKYPDVTTLGTIDEDWSSAIAVPMQSIGAYFLVLYGSIEHSDELACFLKTVGHLLAITLDEPIPVYKPRSEPPTQGKSLTPRQEIIKGLLSKGYTNAHIAKEIGYSESLVRQETIAIYAALRISGREELIKAEQALSIKA